MNLEKIEAAQNLEVHYANGKTDVLIILEKAIAVIR